jgi:hypothetical protein
MTNKEMLHEFQSSRLPGLVPDEGPATQLIRLRPFPIAAAEGAATSIKPCTLPRPLHFLDRIRGATVVYGRAGYQPSAAVGPYPEPANEAM